MSTELIKIVKNTATRVSSKSQEAQLTLNSKTRIGWNVF
jgi:hypothetical protein